MSRRRKTQKGFTIVELMMATTVFSMVLLVCSYSLLEIGRAYYKGATINRTQETARVILDDVTEAIKFDHGAIDIPVNPPTNPGELGQYCIGSRQYDYTLGEMQEDGGSSQLSRSDVANCGGTAANTQGLLANRTRVMKFDIDDLGDNLYDVTVRVASGANDMLTLRTGDGQCINDRGTSQFCAVIELKTTVRRRV